VRHDEASVIEWRMIVHRLLLCEFSGWSEWNQKNWITKFG
jgi:hypothetical protein